MSVLESGLTIEAAAPIMESEVPTNSSLMVHHKNIQAFSDALRGIREHLKEVSWNASVQVWRAQQELDEALRYIREGIENVKKKSQESRAS